MVKKNIIALYAFTLAMTATGAWADSVNVCVTADTPNTYLSVLNAAREVGIVVIEPNKTQVRANNHYQAGAGSYWNSSLPINITLPSGCSQIFLMSKNTNPNNKQPWQCDTPTIVVEQGKGILITGTAPGAVIPINSINIPDPNAKYTTDSSSCPSGT
ncbi:hypothetical protein [Azospirillum sp. B510]|uniref:hypothetical protein n=1 Tax=Azospirillum sp. (strain B510) TaxID=137722 RepID=UPI0011D12AE0|nr:hypothetical protein [Azospirillum sp. B510]